MTAPVLEVDLPGVPSESPRGSSRRNVSRSLSFTALGAAINVPLALLTVPLVLGHLSLTSYGVFATLTSVLSIIGLVEAGVSTEIVRRVAAAHGDDDPAALRRGVHQGLTVLAGLAATVAALGVLCAFVLGDVIFGVLPQPLRGQVPWITLAVTLTFAADLFLSGWFATLQGLQRSDWMGIASLAGVVAGTAANLALVLNGVGVWSLAAGSIVQVVVSGGVRWLGMSRVAPDVSLQFETVAAGDARAYAGTSAVVLIATVANIIDFQFDKILLVNIVGAAAAGAYQIGASLALQARSLSLLPVGVLIPSTAELGEGATLSRLRGAVTQLNTCASLILMGGLVVFGPMFVRLWLGGGYQQTAYAAQILAIALFLNAITGPWYTHCLGTGLVRIPLTSALANAAVNASVSWTLISVIGFNGAVYGSLAGNAAGAAVFAFLMYLKVPGSWLSGLLRPTLLVCAASVGGLSVMDTLAASWLTLVAGAVVWTGLLGCVFTTLGWLPPEVGRALRRPSPARPS